MTKAQVTQQGVSDALDEAADYGYRELIGMDPEQVAIDLLDCNSDFEHLDVDDVLEFVKAWQAARRAK